MIKKYSDFINETIQMYLAPNGRRSNLTNEQWYLVRTPQFKNWFGDWEIGYGSKVLDENGEPRVMYHGSKSNFTSFNLGAEKVERTNNFSGFYFTANKQDAISYSKSGKIYECFINIRKPLVFKNGFKNRPSNTAINWVQNKYEPQFDDIYLNAKIENLKSGWWSSFMNGDDSREMAIIDGYDGYFDGTVELCAFYPNAIKIADGSNKTFDKSSNDITL